MSTVRYKFTIEERVWLVRAYYQQNADYALMFTDFTKQFERTGNVADATQSGCPRSVRSTDNTEIVAFAFTENPQQSAVRVSNQLGILRSSVHRMMKDVYAYECIVTICYRLFQKRIPIAELNFVNSISFP